MRKKDQDTVESDGRHGVDSEVGATKLCTEYRLWILRDTWTGFILLCGHVSYNAGAQLKHHSLFSPCVLNDTPVCVIVGVSQVLMCGLCCSLSQWIFLSPCLAVSQGLCQAQGPNSNWEASEKRRPSSFEFQVAQW